MIITKKYIHHTLLLVFAIGLFAASAQTNDMLFEPFYFGMPKKEAKQVLKEFQESNEVIAMGTDVFYVLKSSSLIMEKDRLVELKLWTKDNISSKKITAQLQKTKAHLESIGFEVVYKQKNWDKPLLLDPNKPGVRFLNKQQTVLLEMEPRGQGNKYNIYLNYYNMEWVKKHLTPAAN